MFERIDISDSTIHTKSLTKESSNKSKLRAQSRIHNKHDREEQKSLKEISDRQEAQNVKLGDQVFESVVNRISKNKIFQSLPVTMHSVLRQFDELSNTESNQNTGIDGTEDTPTSRLFMPKAPSSNPTGNLTFSEQVRGIFQKKDPLDEESEDLDIPIKGRFRVSEFLRDRVLKHEQNLSDTQALRFGSKLEKIRNYHILKQMEDSLNSGNFVGSLENDEQKLNWGSMPFSQKVMRALQANDEECQKIIKELNDTSQKSTWATVRSGTPSSGSLTHFVQNDILMVSPPRHKSAHKGALLQANEARIFVPEAIRSHLLHTYHRSPMLCHPGSDKMYHTLNKVYYWPNMQSDTVRTVKGCLACARVKTPYRHTKDPMYGFLPSEPFSHVHVDLAGPLPADRKGNTHILCITCSMSRWTVLVAIGEDSDGHIDAIAIANSMVENWIKYYGVPECIISDKGSVFEAEIHRELMQSNPGPIVEILAMYWWGPEEERKLGGDDAIIISEEQRARSQPTELNRLLALGYSEEEIRETGTLMVYVLNHGPSIINDYNAIFRKERGPNLPNNAYWQSLTPDEYREFKKANETLDYPELFDRSKRYGIAHRHRQRIGIYPATVAQARAMGDPKKKKKKSSKSRGRQ
jgi:hypothetical protein